MRGGRTPWLVLFAAATSIIVALFILLLGGDDARNMSMADPAGAQRAMADLGRALFTGLMLVEAALGIFVTPALTAGTITTEREQSTLELLQLTTLSGTNIVLGKLLSALSFLFLLLLCALPVSSLVFLYGGVSPAQLVLALLLIVAIILAFGAIGVFCSARFRTTGAAAVIAYLICGAWLGLLPLTGWLLELFQVNTVVGDIWVSLWLSIALLLLLSLVPTVIIGSIYALATNRRMSRLWIEIIWGAWASGALLTLNLPHALDQLDVKLFFVANPVICLMNVLKGDLPDFLAGGQMGGNQGIGSLYSQATGVADWGQQLLTSEAGSVVIAIAMLLLGGWLALVLAIRELRRRHG